MSIHTTLYRRLRRWRFIPYALGSTVFFLLCIVIVFLAPPRHGPAYPHVFVVSEGETVRDIAARLHDHGVITSETIFIVANRLFGGTIVKGSYHFQQPAGPLFRAREMYYGVKNMPLRRITVPEESDLHDLAVLFENSFKDFDRETFEELALEYHGYLYPDTYLFFEDEVTPEHLITIMTKTFERRTDDLFASYDGSLTKQEVVALASIVELEAGRLEDRRTIAGVLLNRLDQDMKLQVDVSFLFINDKDTFDLSKDDLASDHPLNSYKNHGIPPIPLVNPSRESIEAVMNPTESDYLYFVGDGRKTYFSETYEEHLEKKRVYVDTYKKK